MKDITSYLKGGEQSKKDTKGTCSREEWEQMNDDCKIELIIQRFFTSKPLRSVFEKEGKIFSTFYLKSGANCHAYLPSEMAFLSEYYFGKYDINIFYIEGEDNLEKQLEQLVAESECSAVKKTAFVFKTSTAEGVDPKIYALHFIPIIFENFHGVCSLFILDSDYAFTSRGMKSPFTNQKKLFNNDCVYCTGVSLQSDTASCIGSSWASAKEALNYKGKLKDVMVPLTDRLLGKLNEAQYPSTLYPSTFKKVMPSGPFSKYTQRAKIVDVMRSPDNQSLFYNSLMVNSKQQSLEDYLIEKNQPETMDTKTYCLTEGMNQNPNNQEEREKYMQLHEKGIMNIKRTMRVIDQEFASGKHSDLDVMVNALKSRQELRLQSILKVSVEAR
ncbi:MAG: hypothetical protein ACPGEF_03725 [Endozoicomonas sp.]